MGVIVNRVVGNGNLNIFVNGELRGQATPSHPINVEVWNGDIVTWYSGAYIGSSFIKLCDVPQTECSSTVSTVRQMNIYAEPFTMTMEATFTDAPVYKWLCNNGVCVQGAGGTYDTKAECEASGCNPLNPGLSVNGKQGSVTVPLNSPVQLKISGIGADKAITITNVGKTPDINIGQGTTDANGIFVLTTTFTENERLELRGYYNCLGSVCLGETNTVTVIAGSPPISMWTVVIVLGLLVVVFFYSKELGIFDAIKKR